MAKRYNIRMAGVGGQGVVTASHILSTAVIHAGGESTIVPFYGSEKRMAPVEWNNGAFPPGEDCRMRLCGDGGPE